MCTSNRPTSPRGVDADAATEKDEGAGDQGIMFGYACRETEPLMPAPIFYAHRILHEMAKARHTGRTPELGPDAKSQVTLAYEDGKPVRADFDRGLHPAWRGCEPGAGARRSCAASSTR